MISEDALNNFFKQAHYQMADVGNKRVTERRAMAMGTIVVGKSAFELIKNNQLPKGNPLILAEIAAVNGAKQAFLSIPLCHPMMLDQVKATCILNEDLESISVYCLATTSAKTGVEMEALAGVTLFTHSYDLTKMVEPALTLQK